MATSRIGEIRVNFTAGTADFEPAVERMTAKVRTFGGSVKSGSLEGSAALRLLEGNFNNNLRTIGRWLSQIEGAGPILKAAFPTIGAIAFGVFLEQLGEKAYNFFKTIREGAEKASGAFRDINAPLRTSIAELEESNAKLKNEIAQLEGKRQDNITPMLEAARVAAAKLAEQLQRDTEALNKLLTEHRVGIAQQIFGVAGTNDLTKLLGGESGSGGFAGALATLMDQYNDRIEKAATMTDKLAAAKEKDAIKTDVQRRTLNLYQAAVDQLEGKLKQLPAEVPTEKGGLVSRAMRNLTGSYLPSPTVPDSANRREQITDAIRDLKEQMAYVKDEFQHEGLGEQVEGLKINKANEKPGDIFLNRMKAIRAETALLEAKLAGVGQSQALKEQGEAAAEAGRVIEELNKQLDKLPGGKNQQLKEGGAEFGQIKSELLSQNRIKDETKWQEELKKSNTEISIRVKSLHEMTDALSAGAAAVTKVSVETALADKLQEHYTDVIWRAQHATEISALTNKLYSEEYAKIAEKLQPTINKINDHIHVEQAQARAQVLGGEAVRRAALEEEFLNNTREYGVDLGYRISGLQEKEYEAARENNIAKIIADENLQREKSINLLSAAASGAEALRQAELEAKYAKTRFELGPGTNTDDAIALTRLNDESEHRLEIIKETNKSVLGYRDRLNQLAEELAYLKSINAEQSSIRQVESEQFKLMAEQTLQSDKMRAGLQSFFLEMYAESLTFTETLNRNVVQAFTSALSDVSSQFAKFLTGQKTSFGKAFQQLGEKTLGDAIKAGATKGIGAIYGKITGVKPPGSKEPTGTYDNPTWVMIKNSASQSTKDLTTYIPKAPPGDRSSLPSGYSGILGNASGVLGSVFKKIGGLFGLGGGGGSAASDTAADVGGLTGLASGGPVSPDEAYLVGENGPELLYGASGRIASNSETQRALGGNGAMYYIDARGTDANLVEQRVNQSLSAIHGSAVATSVQAVQERQKRVPQRSH